MFFRYPDPKVPGDKNTGFMTQEEAESHWKTEDFTPLVDRKIQVNDAGEETSYSYLFTPRRPVRSNGKSTAFSIHGPLGPIDYRYAPLSRDREQIRLVTLLPGGVKDPLRCTLSVHDFPVTDGEYTCLSYVWGSPKGTYPMYLDDGIIGVTENLMAALWHIREKTKPVRLWVDALCINQTDDSEKAHQVSMMRAIYLKAHQLISWLGPAQSDTTSILSELNHLFKVCPRWDDQGPGLLRFLIACAKSNWVDLRPIFDSAYWTRVWIVQELAARAQYSEFLERYYSDRMSHLKAVWKSLRRTLVGGKLDYLLYGPCKIPHNWVLVVSMTLGYSKNHKFNLYDIPSLSGLQTFNMDIFSPRQSPFHSQIQPNSIVLVLQIMHVNFDHENLADAYYQMCGRLQATKARDMLYALAPFYPAFKINIDYSKPDTEVVLDIAEAIFKSVKQCTHMPELLLENHALHPSVKDTLTECESLISWVPYGRPASLCTKMYGTAFTSYLCSIATGVRTDTFSNTHFLRCPNGGRLFTQCMYRTRITRLFQPSEDKALRSAISSRFSAQTDPETRKFLLAWLGFDDTRSDNVGMLEDYLDVGSSEEMSSDFRRPRFYDLCRMMGTTLGFYLMGICLWGVLIVKLVTSSC